MPGTKSFNEIRALYRAKKRGKFQPDNKVNNEVDNKVNKSFVIMVLDRTLLSDELLVMGFGSLSNWLITIYEVRGGKVTQCKKYI